MSMRPVEKPELVLQFSIDRNPTRRSVKPGQEFINGVVMNLELQKSCPYVDSGECDGKIESDRDGRYSAYCGRVAIEGVNEVDAMPCFLDMPTGDLLGQLNRAVEKHK